MRPALLVGLALGTVYLVWGSTYLAIAIAIETIPPFLMASARWLAAGAILYAVRRAMGDAAPTPREWGTSAVIGALLIVGGNGGVSWAETRVASGLAALVVAIVPLWFALLLWAFAGSRPTWRTGLGIVLGLTGVVVLVGPSAFRGEGGLGLFVGFLAIVVATVSWATGSVVSKRLPAPRSVLLAASMQMLTGGAMLALLGLAVGEGPRLDVAGISAASWWGLAFLVVLGSIVAYSAYVWLLSVARPQLVATYAFVNPVVAVVLGVWLAHEPFDLMTFVAAVLIVAAVALTVTAPAPAKPEATAQTT